MFEPSNETISQQQCLEIAINNDSLPEDWEVFTLLFSTNNSAVNITAHRVDVYIIDGKYGYFSISIYTCNCQMLVVQDISGQIHI